MNEFPTLTPLFNRAAEGARFELPGDGWYHLVPRGRFPIKDPESGLRIVQVVDETATRSMVNRFEAEMKRPNFPGVLIDYDHFSDDTDKPSAAAGWVQKMENRADGIWGQIKWTPKAEQALKDGEYRFISPVWWKHEAQRLSNSSEYRPTRLESLGLTNQPNLRGMVPLSNRDDLAGRATGPDGENKTKSMKRVNEALGLSPDAAEEAALAEVTKLKNRCAELHTENDTLTTQNAELSEAQIESDLEKYKNRYKPEKREAWKNRLKADRKGAIELLEEMPAGEPPKGGTPSGKMLNRKDARTPADNPEGAGTPEQRAAKIEAAVEEIKFKNRVSHQQAWDMAERLHPELFKQEEQEA